MSIQMELFILLTFLTTVIIPACGLEIRSPTVDLSYAKYEGYHNVTAGINYFRGIPYAQPPIGNFRWRKPQSIEQDKSLRGKTIPATKVAPACYQGSPYWSPSSAAAVNAVTQSEDCLILDVLTPSKPVSRALPVLVQIHGGGYTLGSAGIAPGDGLVHASKGQMIYVSIQYRLGMFGFLAGSEILADGVANAGLYDQRAALEWIQRNIASFGGDPSRVTIWGGSAGGGSVSYQLIAGGAVGSPPFQGAIMEYPWWQPLMNASSQELQYAATLRLGNCTTLDCMRSLSSQRLQQINALSMNTTYPSPGYGYGLFAYGPVVDGKFIRQLPDQEFKQRNFYSVPTIVDHDAYEGVILSNTSLTSQNDETTDARYLFPNAGPSFFSRLYDIYPITKFNSTFFRRQTWFGDFSISCPTYYMASAMTDHNQNSSAVFKLIFSAGGGLHGATAPFLSSPFIDFTNANNQTLAEIMSRYWVSFTVTGDPNPLRSPKAPIWPSYISGGVGDAANGESVGFQTLSILDRSINTVRDPDAGLQCDFFGSQGYQISN